MVYLPIFLQSLICYVIAHVIIVLRKKPESNLLLHKDMIYSSLSNFIGLSLNNAAVHRIDYVLLTMIKSPKSLSIVGITLIVGLLNPSKYQAIERSTIVNVLVFSAGLFLFNLTVPFAHSVRRFQIRDEELADGHRAVHRWQSVRRLQ
jgi:hypothetical protein